MFSFRCCPRWPPAQRIAAPSALLPVACVNPHRALPRSSPTPPIARPADVQGERKGAAPGAGDERHWRRRARHRVCKHQAPGAPGRARLFRVPAAAAAPSPHGRACRAWLCRRRCPSPGLPADAQLHPLSAPPASPPRPRLQCDSVAREMERMGYRVTMLHGGKSQDQREESIKVGLLGCGGVIGLWGMGAGRRGWARERESACALHGAHADLLAARAPPPPTSASPLGIHLFVPSPSHPYPIHPCLTPGLPRRRVQRAGGHRRGGARHRRAKRRARGQLRHGAHHRAVHAQVRVGGHGTPAQGVGGRAGGWWERRRWRRTRCCPASAKRGGLPFLYPALTRRRPLALARVSAGLGVPAVRGARAHPSLSSHWETRVRLRMGGAAGPLRGRWGAARCWRAVCWRRRLMLNKRFPPPNPQTPTPTNRTHCRGLLRPQKVPGGQQGGGAVPAGGARGVAPKAGRHRRRPPADPICQEVRRHRHSGIAPPTERICLLPGFALWLLIPSALLPALAAPLAAAWPFGISWLSLGAT